MSEPAAFVHIEYGGRTRLVGRLWTRAARQKQSATFEYDQSWIADPLHHALGPALPPTLAAHHTREGREIFGAIGDSAPDRWGRRLIERNLARHARELGQTARSPREIDYLLGVSDYTRQGALRFAATQNGPFLADSSGEYVPPLIELGDLLSAARALEADPDSISGEDAVQLLLAPGSSLGGARPKASVRDRGGQLAIAKFPQNRDDTDTVRWEMVMMSLAKRAGIEVPQARIELVGAVAVLITERFDRHGEIRVPFLSAMSLLDFDDKERGSYVEITNALRAIASRASRDGPELWRRLAFNILASNFDDHLRNHAVIYDGVGWCLSPAYDLNPVPRSESDRYLTTAINVDGDNTASIELAIEASEEFLLSRDQARKIAGEVARSVGSWRKTAARVGIDANEIEKMKAAFEHRDALNARRWA